MAILVQCHHLHQRRFGRVFQARDGGQDAAPGVDCGELARNVSGRRDGRRRVRAVAPPRPSWSPWPSPVTCCRRRRRRRRCRRRRRRGRRRPCNPAKPWSTPTAVTRPTFAGSRGRGAATRGRGGSVKINGRYAHAPYASQRSACPHRYDVSPSLELVSRTIRASTLRMATAKIRTGTTW